MNEIESLIKLTNIRLEKNSDEIETLVNLSIQYDFYKQHCSKNGIDYSLINEFLSLINIRIFINFLRGDILSSLNSYNRAETTYESRFSTRNIIVIINEGIKKIYNFTNINEEGIIKISNRNNSFWIKNIKPIALKYKNIQVKYENITNTLDKFLENDFKKLKSYRDLSIHYDQNSIKVVKMIVAVEYQEIEKYALDFFSITTNIVDLLESTMEITQKEIQEKYK
ncbi:hypothetical protein [Soonwooa purpurea]